MAKFKPGQSGNAAGKPAGARNRLQADFLQALAEDFKEHGPGVVRIARVEKPLEYLKVVASLMPKELHVQDSVLQDMSDAELLETRDIIRRLKAERTAIVAATNAEGD